MIAYLRKCKSLKLENLVLSSVDLRYGCFVKCNGHLRGLTIR